MGRRAARPRSAATGRGEPERQDLEGAHRRRGDRFGAAAGLRHRHSTADPGHPAAGPGSGQPTLCTGAPGSPPVWCHAPLISPVLRAKSATCKFEVLKLGLTTAACDYVWWWPEAISVAGVEVGPDY